jgi:hypothetical protein
MEQKGNMMKYAVLSYEIVSSRVRKDIFRMPEKGGVTVSTHWEMKPEKEQLELTLSLALRDKSVQNQIELGFISVKGIFHVLGLAMLGEHELVPIELLHRLGQKTCDIAYGVLLSKSVGTALYGLPMDELPPQAFIQQGFPGMSMN